MLNGLEGKPVNFRDLGDGRRVRTGIAFRSGVVDGLTPAGQKELFETGVRLVCDLRTAAERADQPDTLPPEIDYQVLDVQRDGGHGADIAALFTSPESAAALSSPEAAEAFLIAAYRAFVSAPDACDAYRGLLLALSRPGTLMHCTAGKDRTGWGSALLQTLLGVDHDTVMADYLASNAELAAAAVPLYALAEQHGIGRDLLRPLLEVRESYLDAAFDEVSTTYGDISSYVRHGLAVPDSQVGALRELYLS